MNETWHLVRLMVSSHQFVICWCRQAPGDLKPGLNVDGETTMAIEHPKDRNLHVVCPVLDTMTIEREMTPLHELGVQRSGGAHGPWRFQDGRWKCDRCGWTELNVRSECNPR